MGLLIGRIMPWVAGASLVGLSIMTGLYLDQRDKAIEERAACNVGNVQAALDAANLQLETEKRNRKLELEERDRRIEREREAREIAEAAARNAIADRHERETLIDELSREDFDEDEIPDSQACLNAFMLRDSLDGLRLRAAHSAGSRAGGSPAASSPRSDSARSAATDLATRAFAAITYGDAVKLWGRDRDNLQLCNDRLSAIKSLSDQVTNE